MELPPRLLESRSMADNKLFYGDNLDVLRRYVRDESVDLIYLDPPFNSRQDYNVLFAEKDGTRSSSQITAFEDTWEWNLDAERAYQEVVERGGWVSNAMQAFRTFLGNSDMMAYLAMMAPRLIELKRVLKVTGSIYLHCDPTASHYLKMLMDAVFRPEQFRTRLSGSAHLGGNALTRFASSHDVLLFYARRLKQWNPDAAFRMTADLDEDRTKVRLCRLGWTSLPANQPAQPKSQPTESDLRVSRSNASLALDTGCNERWISRQGLIVQPHAGACRDTSDIWMRQGLPISDVWADIPPINSQAKSASAIQPKSPRPSLNASSRPAATKATSFSIPSADAARRLSRRIA